MRAREWAFVLASAWVGAVAFCTAVRVLCGCAPAGQVYIPAKHFQWRAPDPMRGAALAALAAKAREETSQAAAGLRQGLRPPQRRAKNKILL
jgi:hypothetical protein